MKKKIGLGFIFLLLGCLLLSWEYWSVSSSKGNLESFFVRYSSREKPVKMIVATDLHYLSSKLTDKGNFFTDLFNNADGKNMQYIEEITEAFVENVIAEKPEILVISGDLTFNGEKDSHLDLERKLHRIQNNGTQVLVIPGNHDIDRSSAAGFYGDHYELVDSITKEEFLEIYKKYGLQNTLQKDDTSLSYIYKVRSDFWLLMLDSNSDKVNQISDKTLTWVERTLQEAREKNVQVLAVSHQNILSHNPHFREGFVIDKANELEVLYRKYGVLANVSGHIHIQHMVMETLPEILTSSLAVSPHQYGVIDFDGKNFNYQASILTIDDWARRHQSMDTNLLQFQKSSRQFMEAVAWRKAESELLDTKLTDSEKNLLLETFTKLNADYFAGKSVNEADYEAGLELWRKKGSGVYLDYLETILKSTKKSYNKLNLMIDE